MAAVTPVDSTLAERGSRYGSFKEHARITQNIKDAMRDSPNWPKLDPAQREALEMIAHKAGRILNGDPNYGDSWHDIAGYSRLVEQELAGVATGPESFRPQAATPSAPVERVVESPRVADVPPAAPVSEPAAPNSVEAERLVPRAVPANDPPPPVVPARPKLKE